MMIYLPGLENEVGSTAPSSGFVFVPLILLVLKSFCQTILVSIFIVYSVFVFKRDLTTGEQPYDEMI